MSDNTLWDNKYVVVDNFRVHQSGRIDFKRGDKWEECQTFTWFEDGRSPDIPGVNIRYVNHKGQWTHTPAYPLVMRAMTGNDETRSHFARPIDGDIRNMHYLNIEVFDDRTELLAYNEKLLKNGYYCKSCHTYNVKGMGCKGCERYASYLEELSDMYPNPRVLKNTYGDIIRDYKDGGTDEEIVAKVVKTCGSINVLGSRIDRLYDAELVVWKSTVYNWLYQKMILEDTITANDLVRAKLTVDKFVDKAKEMNPNLEYVLYNGEVRGNDISILIKESALID